MLEVFLDLLVTPLNPAYKLPLEEAQFIQPLQAFNAIIVDFISKVAESFKDGCLEPLW
jgi:hypothetical protein